MSIAVKIGKKEPIYVFCYEGDIKKAEDKKTSLEYFIYGEGRKRTKQFEKIDIPEKRSGYEMSWMEIAKYTDEYGIYIGEGYADCKVAGIIARQTAAGRCEMYKRCKHLLTKEDTAFFDLLKPDYMLSCFGIYELDIIGLDERLAKIDPEYSANEAMYKGEPISMNEYIRAKYGAKAVEIIEACLAGPVQFRGRYEKIENFVKQNYLSQNILQLALDNFTEWLEEMDVERQVKKVISKIESNTLQLKF